MRALFTYSFIGEVDDEEEASTIALEIERVNELGLLRVMEMHPDVSREELDSKLDMLGVTVQILSEKADT